MLEKCSLVVPIVQIRLSNVFSPTISVSIPPIFEWCYRLSNIDCWAVLADCSIYSVISAVKVVVDVEGFICGMVGDGRFRIHHIDSVVSPGATQ